MKQKIKNLFRQEVEEDDDLIVSISKAKIVSNKTVSTVKEAESQFGCASDRKLLLLAELSGCCSVHMQLIGFVANG